jgi:hypothetical protein
MLRPLLEKTLGPILVDAAASFDVAVVRLAQEIAKRGSDPRRRDDVRGRQEYLEGVAATYGALDPATFFAKPPPIEQLHAVRVRELHAREPGEVLDWSWRSGWLCATPDQREKWARWHENDTVYVRRFRHRLRRAPAIVCIHGYRAGTFGFEERAFGAEWLYGLGLDVALFTLPFHALRAPGHPSHPGRRRGTPLFPTADIARTNEAFGQATWDLRRLIARLRNDGAPAVGVMGMSLGGYTASLLATVEKDLDFAVPFIPLADLTEVVAEHEALRGVTVPPSLVEAGKRAMALVRPLARPPLLPPEKMMVVGAVGDRITRASHAESLAAHFGCELVTFPGAHLLQFGRRAAFASIAKLLARRGILGPRR